MCIIINSLLAKKGRDYMSNKERIMELIYGIPDRRLVFIVDMLESLKAYAGEEIPPDEWDLQMIQEAEKENDGKTISFEEIF